MKKLIISILSLLCIATSFAQEQPKSNSSNTSVQKDRFTSIADVDSYIKAVQTKIEYVKNTPEEHAIALKEGWYEKMEKNIQKALIQREELVKASEDNNNK
ncbi:hypothetical protein GCM10009118_27600 [Wandonia haliotis]|uniref:Uncharacterized protein n=1 Tax=Wandonia haliotis TaxID=574963 RepID=A0ABN1MSV7_9FLAO